MLQDGAVEIGQMTVGRKTEAIGYCFARTLLQGVERE